MTSEVKIIHADKLRDYCARLFQQVGVPADEAIINADSLVEADLKGIESHGVSRMSIYLKRLRVGVIRPAAEYKIVAESPATALCDACNSMGAAVSHKIMKLAITKAKTAGISFISTRNSNHYGAAAYFASMALPHDMIGFTATNGPSRMAPWGGARSALQHESIRRSDSFWSTLSGGGRYG